MTCAQQMLETNPSGAAVDAPTLVECIEACCDCAQACTACADACLSEDDPKPLSHYIRLSLHCAGTCEIAGRIVSWQTTREPQLTRAFLQACAEACRLCPDECEQHASHHEHCQVCAEACRRCERACNDLLASLPAWNPLNEVEGVDE